MGLQINIEENVFLRDIRDKGIAIGMAQGIAKTLCDRLDAKFGTVPVWAVRRIHGGSSYSCGRARC